MITDEDKRAACFASLTRTNDKKQVTCLVCGVWRTDCVGCVWEVIE